jgi:WD40 repeat protein/Flp pilus assembly protein TadD
MSPEQALAHRIPVDHRTDIYSLGVTLYELLTLKPAFGGPDRQELLRQIAFEEPRAPRHINASIPVELETIVLKAMEKNPAERYATAQELADDLERFLKDEPIRARRPSVLLRVRKWTRRHRSVVATAAVAGVLLLAALATVTSVAALWLRDERNATRGQLIETRNAQREGRFQLYQAKLAQAQARRWSGRVGQRFESLQTLTEAAQLAQELNLDETHRSKLRNEVIACLALPDVRLVKEWQGCPPGTHYDPVFDGHLERYARGEDQGAISIRRVADDQELARLPGPGRAAVFLKFSPRGDLLAVAYAAPALAQERIFRLWDWQRGAIVWQATFAPAAAADFSPDGAQLVVGQAKGALVFYDLAARNETTRWDLGSPPEALAFDRESRQLAIGFPDGAVQVRDLPTGKRHHQFSHPDHATALAWHPHGNLLAVACYDGRVYLWHVASGRQHAVLAGHQGSTIGVAFAPTGDLLLSWGWDWAGRLWDPWTGRQLLTFPGASPFSTDGRWLAGRNGAKLGLWEVTAGREYRALQPSGAPDPQPYHDGDISPDGRWLAVGAGQGVTLADVATGQDLAFLPLGSTQATLFHPNGRELFTSGRAGLFRWPVQVQSHSLRLGPPQRLASGALQRMGLDQAGRTLAVAGQHAGRVWRLDKPLDEVQRVGHVNAFIAQMSRDGRWVVTGTYNGFGLKVWDAHDGQLVRDLKPEARVSYPAFSPDGRFLVTSTEDGFDLFGLPSWDHLRRTNRDKGDGSFGRMAFTADSQLLALEMTRDKINLVDPATGRLFATLQAPDPDLARWLGFTPDGCHLVVSSTIGKDQGRFRAWDLRRIRTHLKAIGLDWKPANPMAAPAEEGDPSRRGKPVQVEVDLGDFAAREKYSFVLGLFPFYAEGYYRRGLAQAGFEQWQPAFEDFNLALALQPDHAEASYHRGLIHARQGRFPQALADFSRTCTLLPEHDEAYGQRARAYAALGQWRQALADYSKAIARRPAQRELWSGRGYAHLAVGQWREAVADASQVIALKPAGAMGWHGRGDAYAVGGQWDQAAADFARAAEVAPHDANYAYKHALVRLALADTGGYRRICAALVDRFAQTAGPRDAYLTAWTCVLAPASLSDPILAVQLAEQAVMKAPKNPCHCRTLGAASYRAGRYEDTVQQLTAVAAAGEGAKDSQGVYPVYTWLFLAMAHHRLNHVEDARRWLDKAIKWEFPVAVQWNRRLTASLLRREAEELIKGVSTNPPSDK